ncbi:MAK10-like protein [Tanacetum coccineum]
MGDANPIRTLRDYSRPSHEGCRNTIELPEGNNVIPLDPTPPARNWLECLPAGSISTWEDLSTRFLTQFFQPGRTAKLHNDILMFQQHQESLFLKHGLVSRTYSKKSLIMASTFGSKNTEESWALLEDFALYDNESWNVPRDFAKPVKAISLPQDVPSTSDRRLIKLENQVQHLMEAHIAPKQPIQAISEKLDDMPTHNTAGNPTAKMNLASTNYPTKEELRGKGIKSPSKLLSLKYLTQSSLAEQNRNPSSPKRVHFVNSIIILNKEDEAKESVKSSATEYKDHEMRVKNEEEFEEETKEETEEEEEDNPKHFDVFSTTKKLGYHEWLLKNPRPPWVKAKIRIGNLNNVKFSCMIGYFDKKQAYLDVESPINVMSRLHYNWIMSSRLEPIRKPSNPKKICNFVGRVRGLKVFIGNFTYECDLMVLKDTTSVIDHDLGSVVFGKPFVEASGLVYDIKEGTVVFEKDKEKIMFKMPHKMEMFKHIDFMGIKTDRDAGPTIEERAISFPEAQDHVVYSAQPRGPLDLISLLVSGSVPKKVHDFVEGLREVHKVVRDNLVLANSKYKQDVDQKRRHVDFEATDFMWVVLTKDCFPVGEYNKLSAKKIGPLEIVKKINSSAYRLKLPSHIRCSGVFNVKHLFPYHGDSSDDDLVMNSRVNFVYLGGMIQAQVLKNGPFCPGPAISKLRTRRTSWINPGIRVNQHDQFVLSLIFRLHQLVSRAEVPIKMPSRRNMPLTEAYEQEFERRVMARMEERLDQFVDQLVGRMNEMMNLRRCRDSNGRGSEGEESENPFFEGDGSSSDEEPDRPRRVQREDNRR